MNDFIYNGEEEKEEKEKVKTLGVERIKQNLYNNKNKDVKKFIKQRKCYLCQFSNRG